MVGAEEPPHRRRARAADFPVRKRSSRSSKKAHRAAASACAPRAARRCAKARCCSPTAASSEPIGKVTSGGFGPSLNAPVAMGYLPTSLSANGTQSFAEVRGQRLPLQVAAMPFVPNTYKR